MEENEFGSLPPTAPGLLHSLRTLFDTRSSVLRLEALAACKITDAACVPVKFFHRCMEVTAFYDRLTDRFTQLRACDIGDVDMESPTFCITLQLNPVE